MKEITFRSVIIGGILAIILAASNTFLALKIGILTSASIPAAVISMGILRFFKRATIHENNMIQTCASAGEAIAGGIVYAIPALILIKYWTNFGYWHNFFIALIGGTLGVLFSVPIRKTLMNNKHLRFPEAQAITRVLQMEHEKSGNIHQLLLGGGLGGILEFFQSGLQIIASSAQKFITLGKTTVGFGAGFSATLIGAGYLIGFPVGLSLLIGAVTGYLVILPVLTGHFDFTPQAVLSEDLRFIGIGSMLTAGVWTLITMAKSMAEGLVTSLQSFEIQKKDIPFFYVLLGIIATAITSYVVLNAILPSDIVMLSPTLVLTACFIFIFVIGFIFAAICGYFSGLVGVTATPGSAIVIGGLMIAAFTLRGYLHLNGIALTQEIILNACAVVIVLIAIVEGIACITNDNIQDLKVGHLIGSTPWKQQIMLLLGVLCASAVVPLLMQLLFSVYGIGNIFPHAGMDPSKVLPAPIATVLATMTQAIFNHDLPYNMLFLGAGISIFFIILSFFTSRKISVLGIAMGLYLPLASSTALFLGSFIALFSKSEKSVLTACGLVAGTALMDVLLAIPFAVSGNPNALRVMPTALHDIAIILGILSVAGLAKLLVRKH